MFIKKILNKVIKTKNVLESKKYYRSLKDIHKGKRGFVIGNGPSLKIEDLGLLKNDITIASNKIYLAFEETSWRPSYYTIADQILWPKIKEKIYNYNFNDVHIPSYLNSIPKKLRSSIRVWNSESKNLKFSDKYDEKVYGGGSITYENLQFAYHLGLNPIYILGCDHNYIENTNKTESVITTHQNYANHFHKDYRKSGEKVNSANVELMNKSYTTAKEFFLKKNIDIFNITRGGKLEIFERKDFDDIV